MYDQYNNISFTFSTSCFVNITADHSLPQQRLVNPIPYLNDDDDDDDDDDNDCDGDDDSDDFGDDVDDS